VLLLVVAAAQVAQPVLPQVLVVWGPGLLL
jgi:hypothetical protein